MEENSRKLISKRKKISNNKKLCDVNMITRVAEGMTKKCNEVFNLTNVIWHLHVYTYSICIYS